MSKKSIQTVVFVIDGNYADFVNAKDEMMKKLHGKVEITASSINDEITYTERLEALLEENDIPYSDVWDDVYQEMTNR